jgi:hypothetical protein
MVDRTSGRVRALRSGRVLVSAASGAGRDSVVISVRRPGARVSAVGSIAISPAPGLRVGDSLALRAVVLGIRGDTLSNAELTWTSSDPSVAIVDALTGVAHAQAPGTAQMLARIGNDSSVTELTVLPGPVAAIQILGARPMAVRETLALRVTASDGRGGELTGIPVAWSSSDSTVAAVDGSTGEVVGRAPGSARIAANVDEATAWIRLTVLPRPTPLPAAGEAGSAEARLMAGVEECYGAVQAKDLTRLEAMWHPERGADADRLRRLSRVLRDWGASVGERIDRAPAIGLESASLEFGVPLTWREPAGARSGLPVFRAEFVRAAGRWELSSCRINPSSRF